MIKVGLIGFGRMGRFYLHEFQRNKNWQVTYICDPYDKAQEMARDYCPTAKVTGNEDDVFNDPEVDVVALCTGRLPQKPNSQGTGTWKAHYLGEAYCYASRR